MALRIGLYGGSFDPIHHGHLIVARAVAEQLELDRVIFLPSARPPHKDGDNLAPTAHRAALVKLAIAGEPRFEFSDYDLTRGGPSYTIDTVQHFRKVLGDQVVLHWIIGTDSLAELTTWHRIDALIEACRVVTAARGGVESVEWDALASALSEKQVADLKAGVLETPVIDISATDIRARIGTGRSIRFLVPGAVRAYIEEHALYGFAG